MKLNPDRCGPHYENFDPHELLAAVEDLSDKQEEVVARAKRFAEDMSIDTKNLKEKWSELQSNLKSALQENNIDTDQIDRGMKELVQNVVKNREAVEKVQKAEDKNSTLKAVEREYENEIIPADVTNWIANQAEKIGMNSPLGLLVLMYVVVIASVMFMVEIEHLLPGAGHVFAVMVFNIIICPYVEEIAKATAIEQGYPKLFSSFLAVTHIARRMLAHGISGGILRSVPMVIVTFLTTWYMKYFMEDAKEDHVHKQSVHSALLFHSITRMIMRHV